VTAGRLPAEPLSAALCGGVDCFDIEVFWDWVAGCTFGAEPGCALVQAAKPAATSRDSKASRTKFLPITFFSTCTLGYYHYTC